MSRRSRNRIDKRDMAIELARYFGHGTPMPDEEHDDGQPDDWQDSPRPGDHRVPIGPTDCRAPLNSERHA